MTAEQAKANQDELAKHYDLSYWYGTNCRKCCGVYPKFRTTNGFDSKCFYECEVCGARTDLFSMPWLAERAWNNGEFLETQYSLF